MLVTVTCPVKLKLLRHGALDRCLKRYKQKNTSIWKYDTIWTFIFFKKIYWILAIASRNIDLLSWRYRLIFCYLWFEDFLGFLKILQEINFLLISSLKKSFTFRHKSFHIRQWLLRYVKLLQHFLAFGPFSRAPWRLLSLMWQALADRGLV